MASRLSRSSHGAAHPCRRHGSRQRFQDNSQHLSSPHKSHGHNDSADPKRRHAALLQEPKSWRRPRPMAMKLTVAVDADCAAGMDRAGACLACKGTGRERGAPRVAGGRKREPAVGRHSPVVAGGRSQVVAGRAAERSGVCRQDAAGRQDAVGRGAAAERAVLGVVQGTAQGVAQKAVAEQRPAPPVAQPGCAESPFLAERRSQCRLRAAGATQSRLE